MKKFILNVFIFMLLLLVINGLFFHIVYNLYLMPYETVSVDYNTYLLSDSHGEALGNGIEKYGICNFSVGSDSYIDMQRKLKYLVNKAKIERVIVGVGDHSLSPYRIKANNLDRSVSFISRKEYSNIFSLLGVYIKRYMVLLDPKSRDILKVYFKSKVSKKKKGFYWPDMPDVFKKEQSLMRYKKQFLSNTNSSDALVFALNEIIKTCKNNNIELIGVKFPLDKNYVKAIGDRNYGADKILMENGCTVYDYKELYIDKSSFFKDTDHLNDIGAIKFSRKLAESVLP